MSEPRLGAPRDPQIPWRHRLTTKLLAATLTFTFVSFGVFTLSELHFRDALLDQVTSASERLSLTIEPAISKAMLENRRDDVQETLRGIGAQPGIQQMRLLGHDGRVIFSTSPAEVGRTLSKSAAPCAACHTGPQLAAQIPSTQRTLILDQNGARSMSAFRPIYNEPRCATAACHEHPASNRVLGLIDVEVPLREMDARISSYRTFGVLFTVISVLAVGGFFLVFARRHVVQPVFALLDGTRRVAHDELDVEIHVKSKGELGLLADAFNEMTRELRRAEDDLRQLNHSLEQKVEERSLELKRAHASLMQTEKLSSLGQLSASIAHEINNPLAGILTFARTLIRSAEQDVPDEARRKALVRNLNLIHRETQRCSAIVRNLLDFARERPLELRDVDLNVVVEESIQLIAHQAGMLNESVEKKLADLPRVRGDFGQLRQAVVNVALNACEAMAGGGRLTVSTTASPEGDWVELDIADTGPGIAAENLPRIFDPFFTTKEKGTGLGLSVVYGIVQRHGGTIEVSSEPGNGATFAIRLPACGATRMERAS